MLNNKQLNIRRGVLRMEEERVHVCLNIAARRECLVNLEEAAQLSKHLACSDGERGPRGGACDALASWCRVFGARGN